MTSDDIYTAYTPAGPPAPFLRRWATALGRGLGAAVKRLQYTRMIEALNHLTDAQLAEIELQRSDIPAYAHRLVYELD